MIFLSIERFISHFTARTIYRLGIAGFPGAQVGRFAAEPVAYIRNRYARIDGFSRSAEFKIQVYRMINFIWISRQRRLEIFKHIIIEFDAMRFEAAFY